MADLSSLGSIKLFGLLQRKSGTSLEAFRHHWRTAHKDEALKLKHFMTAYNQNHRRPEPVPGLKNAADGCPEIWFRSIEDVIAMQASDEYMTGAYVDEPNFMEGRATGLVLSERVLEPGPMVAAREDYVRVSVFLKKHVDVGGHAFMQWLETPKSCVMELSTDPVRHTRSICLAARDDVPVYDAVESYWWPNMDRFRGAWASGSFSHEAAGLIDVPGCTGLLTQEERVIWPEDGVDYGR